MTFTCKCGSKHYELFRGARYGYATADIERVNMIDNADVWWTATCEGCGQKWGNYSTRKILKEVMVDAGVLL